MVTLRKYTYPHEAHLLRMALGMEGIPCVLRDEHTIGLNWLYSNALGGIKVDVATHHLEQALIILNEFENKPVLSEDGTVLSCAKCNSTKFYSNVPVSRSFSAVFALFVSYVLSVFPFHLDSEYRCKNCFTILPKDKPEF